MSRDVNIEECLVNGALVAGLTTHEARLLFKGFGAMAYPPVKKFWVEYGDRCPLSGKREMIDSGYKSQKNGWKTQFINECNRLWEKEAENNS